MKTATTHEAKTHLSRLLKEVQAGETVVILNRNIPIAQLTTVEAVARARPRVGTITSEMVQYDVDAFAPLSEADLATWDL